MSRKSRQKEFLFNPDYRGIYVKDHETASQRKKRWNHKILLYHPNLMENSEEEFYTLHQVVNVYEHSMEDFEFNARKIIKHYAKYYGDTSLWIYTLAQTIQFKVYPEQETPFELSLFPFFVNYLLLVMPIECGCDLTTWEPWIPYRFSAKGWEEQMNRYIADARSRANMRKLCECIELTKYMMNLWAADVGSRIGLSISNNELIELMKRDKDAYESITCTFDIPKGTTPAELERLTMDRTKDLLKFTSGQLDLSISVYARNNLFNPAQFREYAVHITHKPDLDGTTIPYTYPTNIIMGIKDIRAFDVDARGGRKAEITKLNVSDAGTLERALMMLTSPLSTVDVNYECDSKHFRERYISSAADLEKLEGRVICTDKKKDEYWIIDQTDVDLIGKTVFMKTPITCTHPDRAKGTICAACYGMLMANLNHDVHIGRVAAADSADEIEQKLLSAKHALQTDTNTIEFDELFYQYFDLGNGSIKFNSDVIEMSCIQNSGIDDLYLEFYPHTMGKHQDGESRNFDRSFNEIIIYNAKDDTRITIAEENGATLYLSPEFNDNNFLPKLHYTDTKDVIRIPFTDLVSHGELLTGVLFEFTYKNNELASPLLTLESIMFNCETIREFGSYDECLNTLIPLFVKGGIHVPDYQTEMLVAQMITTPEGHMVDWNDPNPNYVFNSINKSIQRLDSALTSVLYRESGSQIAGAYNTYEKDGTSDYDWFIYSDETSVWS